MGRCPARRKTSGSCIRGIGALGFSSYPGWNSRPRRLETERRHSRHLMGLDSIISPSDRTLVTGSNGFIGAKVVQILLEYGFTNIRCFVRSSSRLEQLERIINEFADTGRNIDVIKGDLLSREDCREAAREVSLIYHLAAGFDKSFAGAFMNSVITTRNLMDAFLKVGRPKRFVNVSSFAVYSNLKLKRGTLVDESCPLENAPQQRFDAYGFGKLKQEQLVREMVLNTSCLT